MLIRRSSLLIVFIFLVFTHSGLGQGENCSCETDLILLNTKIKKTPSYKNNKDIYIDSYAKSLGKAKNITSDYACYVLLNKLLLALNDNHCKIYGTDTGATEEVRNDTTKYVEFKNSPIYNVYPRPNLNLDSLKKVLSSKSSFDIQGIYTKLNYLTIGVFKDDKESDYQAIVLNSEKEIWQKGEIIYTLVPYGNNYLLNIGGDISSKRLIAYPERIENGFFLTMGFQKDISKTNFSLSMFPDSTYARLELSTDITYLKIGSFNSWYPTLSDAETFYKSLEGTLTRKNLILDLRDNGGGGNRNSDILFEIIKEYVKENKVYILTNNRTASNAEQFTSKLTRFENCKSFGDRTSGSAAYELVDANFNLPCGKFIAVLTSKTHKQFLTIESQGIEPDVKFSMGSNWINAMTSYIWRNQ